MGVVALAPGDQGVLAPARPLRVLHVAEALGGGVLEILKVMSAGLVARGHTVALVHGERPETPRDLSGVLADDVVRYPPAWRRRTAGEQLRAARQLAAIVRDWDPDIVHLHSSLAGPVGLLAKAGRPVIYTPHGYSFTRTDTSAVARMMFRSVERAVAGRVDWVATVSEHEAALASEVAKAQRVSVVRNGIPELDDLPEVALPNELRDPLVVGLGRITPARRPHRVARILGALQTVGDTRWIGGAAADDALATPLREAGVPITGWLEHAEARRQLGEAAVYLHWAEWDGAPLAILEAMARDVIVVGSDIPPVREMIGEEQVCASEEEAVALISKLLLDPVAREEALTRQRARRALYGAERMIDGWSRLYEAILLGAS